MLTHISLLVAGIELSLTDSKKPKTGRRHNTKLGEYEPRAGIISCVLVLAEANDGAKQREQRELRGEEEQIRRRSPGD